MHTKCISAINIAFPFPHVFDAHLDSFYSGGIPGKRGERLSLASFFHKIVIIFSHLHNM
jgi:hypothetical protein